MNWEMIAAFIRHALTLGAGVLVTNGWIDGDTSVALVGAVMTLIGIGWSFWAKFGKAS